MATVAAVIASTHHPFYYRASTGEGQQIEVSLMASALSGMANHSAAYLAAGVVPFRMGNAHPSLFPYEALPTADQDLIIIAGNDGQFRKLCEALDLAQLADDPRFARSPERNRNREVLRPLLVERLRTRTANDWFHTLSAAGLPCGPINTIDGGFQVADELGLEPVVQLGAGDDALRMMRNPITFSATPPRYDLPPPRLGQDNESIRAWLQRPAALD